MTADLSLLTDSFRTRLIPMLEDCKAQGFEMVPYVTLRHPLEQAKLWRQSRTTAEIIAKIKYLKDYGAPFLAQCIQSVGVQPTKPHVTNAVPGLSWHQFGRAADCFWRVPMVSGAATYWVGEGFDVFAKTIREHGLTCGDSWNDKDHVQDVAISSPLGLYSLKEIDRMMKDKFSI